MRFRLVLQRRTRMGVPLCAGLDPPFTATPAPVTVHIHPQREYLYHWVLRQHPQHNAYDTPKQGFLTSGITLLVSSSSVRRLSASRPISGFPSRTSAHSVALCWRHTDSSVAPRSETPLSAKFRPS